MLITLSEGEVLLLCHRSWTWDRFWEEVQPWSLLWRPCCPAACGINRILPEEQTRAGKSRVWGHASARQVGQMFSWPPPLESDWQWVGFHQLFGRATGRVNSFPRLKGGHLQNITSSPLGFASCVFRGSWIHNFQCLEMLWKGLQIYQQPDLLRRALYDFHCDICPECQPGLAEPIFNVWFQENVKCGQKILKSED